MTRASAVAVSALRDKANDRFALTTRAIVVVGALAGAAAAGVVIAINPIVLLVAGVAAMATIAIASPAARFAIVVAGGLYVLGTSDQLDAPKLAYFAWVGVSTAFAIGALVAEGDHRLADVPPLLLAAAAVVGAVTLSWAVALSAGTPFIDSLRDAAPYGLLAVAPLLAWDAARSRLGPHMEAAIVVAGLLASVGFAVEFLGRRGITDLSIATLGLGSSMLPAAAFAVAIAAILSRAPRRLLWVTVAAAVLTLVLITGTRSALVLLVGPLAMLFAQGQRTARVIRLGGTVFVVGLAALALALLAAQTSLVDVAALVRRLGSILSLGSNLSVDPSFIERATQAAVASSAFAGSPLAGVGLGYRFEWTTQFGQFYSTYNIDTGLALLAKFGVIGIGLFAVAAGAAMGFYRRLRRHLPEEVRLSFVGFAAISIATLPFGNPIEDKGFGLAVAMLVAWAVASARTARANVDRVAELA